MSLKDEIEKYLQLAQCKLGQTQDVLACGGIERRHLDPIAKNGVCVCPRRFFPGEDVLDILEDSKIDKVLGY